MGWHGRHGACIGKRWWWTRGGLPSRTHGVWMATQRVGGLDVTKTLVLGEYGEIEGEGHGQHHGEP
jgi:hypothetical protein